MSVIERVILQLRSAEAWRASDGAERIDARVQLLVTVGYLIAVLSVPLDNPAKILWMGCYPIVAAEASGMGYGRILVKSLWVLPLVAVIGVFNPIFDREIVWRIGSVAVGRGWLTMASVMIRGLLAMQGLLVLVGSCGFYDTCRALRYFGCPAILVTELLMLYRYIVVLLQESLNMERARQSRGYGRRSYPLRMWGVFVGQLLLRSVARARRVGAAMAARGFEGSYRFAPYGHGLSVGDWIYLVGWLGVFAGLRFVNLSAIMISIIHR